MKEITKFISNYVNTLECEQGVFRLLVTAEICKIMKQGGINKKELAMRMKTSQANITMLLSGDRNFTLDKLFEICHYIGVSPRDVMPAGESKKKGMTTVSTKNKAQVVTQTNPISYQDKKEQRTYPVKIGV